MRIGSNPNKGKRVDTTSYYHQIIIPIHIPNQEDYFKDALEIFKLCLASLFKTSHDKTFITIVNNGSCSEVVDFLNQLYGSGKVHEVIHTSSIGKVNAVFKGLVGHNFKLVTISDADVLFLNDWQQNTYNIFNHFHKSGVVSTTPNPRLVKYKTSNIFFDNLFSGSIQFDQVVNPESIKMFAKSIGLPDFFNQIQLERYLIVSSNNAKAVIGSGHYVATYRGEIFNNLKLKWSDYNLGGNSENNLIDEVVLSRGFWRLSTLNNYTFHMGNTLENWMEETLKSTQDNTQEFQEICFKVNSFNRQLNFVKTKIFPRIIFQRFFWILYLRVKGLSKKEAEIY